MTAPPLERYLCAKDLAQLAQVAPKTVRRWAIRFRVQATLRINSALRWSETDARRLLAAVAAGTGNDEFSALCRPGEGGGARGGERTRA